MSKLTKYKKTNITKTCLVSNKGINKKRKKRRLNNNNNNNTKSKSNVMVKKIQKSASIHKIRKRPYSQNGHMVFVVLV